MFDALHLLLCEISILLTDQMGRLGERYVTEIRVTSHRPDRALVSFDGLGRPFRVLLTRQVEHSFYDSTLWSWSCYITGRGLWHTWSEHEPDTRFANSPDDRYADLYTDAGCDLP